MGLLDAAVDHQVDRIAHDKLTPIHFRGLMESLVAMAHRRLSDTTAGQVVLSALDSLYIGHEQEFADDASDAALAFYDAKDNYESMQAGSDVTLLMRLRFWTHGIPKVMDKHPEWSRSQARDAVHQEWTDDRISDAIRQAAERIHGATGVQGVSDWWQWLKDHWSWQIFFSIVGILLMFIL